jgi:uncharacterized protein YprB with RNaseH-like and TPR domain
VRERLAQMQTQSRMRTTPPSRPLPLATPVESLEPGRWIASEAGEVFVIENARVAPEAPEALACDRHACGFFWPHAQPDALDPGDVLFLDTETTGLAGGTGTLAFLVGVAYWDGDALQLRQYFMRSPAEERALLAAIRPLIAEFKALVTFNGRAFDWPLLDARFILHGHRFPAPRLHLDLLHPARRLWKQRLGSCALSNLEVKLFDVTREDDVPGFLIPGLYFDYLRDGDGRRLRSVFAHNREDIVSLARLYAHLLQTHRDPHEHLSDRRDRLAFGLTLIERGRPAEGVALLLQTLDRWPSADPLTRQAEIEVCRQLKREGRSTEVILLLHRMCDREARRRDPDLLPFEELAKIYEHTERDLDAALVVVERALRLLELRGRSSSRDRLVYRHARLLRRQGRNA